MKRFAVIIFIFMVAYANAASPGYRYQQPQRQTQPLRPSLPQSNNGVYSPVQAPPLPPPQFVPPPAPPAISLPAPPPPAPPIGLPAPHEIAVPAPAQIPISIPQQQYLPPQQHQHQSFGQVQHVQQVQQQVQYQQQQQQSVQAIPSIPQGHQQQVVQQQLAQPIQSSGFQQNFQQSFQQPHPQTAIITKDIFIHSAPEDLGSEAELGPQLDNGPIRKNFRIVFIKAPAQNLRGAAAALKRAQQQNEEKTIIYVLSKKPDLSEVHQQLQQVQGEQKINKPEVYFIKYKTQEEAQRAQQEIQAQYDALGGSTHISDEGVAPVSTIGNGGISSGASNLSGPIGSYSQGGIQQQSFVQQSFQSQSGAGISQKYLPVKAFKK